MLGQRGGALHTGYDNAQLVFPMKRDSPSLEREDAMDFAGYKGFLGKVAVVEKKRKFKTVTFVISAFVLPVLAGIVAIIYGLFVTHDLVLYVMGIALASFAVGVIAGICVEHKLIKRWLKSVGLLDDTDNLRVIVEESDETGEP